jgi:hypothetical protein
LSLAPASIEVAKAFSLAVKASLGNVTAELFSADQVKTLMALPLVETGPVEIVLRDLGGLDLAINEFARAQGSDAQTIRQLLIDNLNAFAADPAQASSDISPAAAALAAFIQSPRGSLTLRLSPHGPLSLFGLIQAVKMDPIAALARLKIDATVSR